jgi:phosphomannomutase
LLYRALELLLTSRALNGSTDIKFVNTSLHGVGHAFVNRSFEAFGFKPFIPVKEQQHPDPEFPSVKFPNPEEAGMTHYVIHN